ncbi:hypothetical protein [Nocardia thraciensis]
MAAPELSAVDSGDNRGLAEHGTRHTPPVLPFAPVPVAESHERLDRAARTPSGHTVLVCAPSVTADTGVSINTVETHLRGIYHKLGVRIRADAITGLI